MKLIKALFLSYIYLHPLCVESFVHYGLSRKSQIKPVLKFSSIPIAFPSNSTNEDFKMKKNMIHDQFMDQPDKGTFMPALQEYSNTDINAVINTAVIAVVIAGVLYQFLTVDAHIMRGWTIEQMAVRIPLDNWKSYLSVLHASPVATKAVTSATVYTVGDFIAQKAEGSSMGTLDRPRLIRSLLAGLVGHGPMSHVWYGVSENLFVNVLHLESWWGTVVKVFIDQIFWGPLWNNTYILLLGLMKMDNPSKIIDEMKRTTVPLIISGLKVWPLAHCVTYGLVPVENRLLWVDLVEILWVSILATTAADKAPVSEEDVNN